MSDLRAMARRAFAMTPAAALAGLLSAIAVGPAPVRAADIDLFLSASSEAYAPNVYVMIDNSANWNSTMGGTTKRELERQALTAVFGGADNELLGTTDDTDDDPVQIRLGFGLFSNSNKPRGGKVWVAVDDFTSSHQDEITTRLLDRMADKNDLKSNNAPYAMSFNEAHAYFAADPPVSGTADGDHDADAITTGSDVTNRYISPAKDTCGKNYVILIGNGEPDSGEDGPAETALRDHGGVLDSDPIDLGEHDNFESNWADEYARFMEGSDVVPDEDPRGDHERNVRTYVIDVFEENSKDEGKNKFESARRWLNSISQRGGGTYYTAHDKEGIKDAFTTILNELLAQDTVFAASSLPVSVNVRGTNLNEVYMGVFRPDEQNRTRWQGNLKLYQLDAIEGDGGQESVILVDSNGDSAQGDEGFIKQTALSFWTHTSSYWDFDPRGTPETGDDAPDGEVVEKGGVHQRVRDEHGSDPAASRTLHTFTGDCTTGSGCALGDFDLSHSAVSSSSLGTADSTEAQQLVDWMHGANNVDDGNDDDSMSDAAVRPSVHGDVLHARPAVVNYGNEEVIAFYGANDGIFHAVQGGKGDSTTEDGRELWGFIPEEFLPRLKSLRDNPTPGDGDSDKKYFADGGIGVYKHDDDGDGVIEPNDGDRVHLYVSMRRGGRLLYALNVSDPENPKFLWKIEGGDEGDGGFAELGQTWSYPEVSRIQYTNDNDETVVRDVLTFGGGYDPGADDPGATDARSMGRALFVVDAMTGEPIWQAGESPSGATHNHPVADMDYSIPSDVTVFDSDGDGYDDRIYVGDTGGQVWRADIDGHPRDWAVHKLASDGVAAGQPERKFLYPPDVVFDDELDGDRYHAVLLGSGDREAPFKDSVTNRFYMFKDRQTSEGVNEDEWQTLGEADLYDATENLIQVGDPDQQSTAEEDLEAAEGWFIDLEVDGAGSGEKVVSSAVTLGGTTFFNTNTPPDDESGCNTALGTARYYEVSFEDASATVENNQMDGKQTDDRYTKAQGGGFPPSPVPVIVEIDGKKYEVVLSGTEAKQPPGTGMGRRNPVYWSTRIDG